MANKLLLPASPAELLERAIETLRAHLLRDAGEAEDHGAALAAMRSLAIVQAELGSDPAIPARELAEIEGLLGRDFHGDGAVARQALANAIRGRQVPSEGPAAVRLRDHLLKAAANRLRLTNPKYMTRRQRRAESSY